VAVMDQAAVDVATRPVAISSASKASSRPAEPSGDRDGFHPRTVSDHRRKITEIAEFDHPPASPGTGSRPLIRPALRRPGGAVPRKRDIDGLLDEDALVALLLQFGLALLQRLGHRA